MWVCLNNAFVSIVKDEPTGLMKVRARKREHLERLFPDQTIHETRSNDYRFRAFVDREVVAGRIADAVRAIDYGNFKDSVVEDGLYDLYAGFWEAHHRYQQQRIL